MRSIKSFLNERYEFRYNIVTGSICYRRKGENAFETLDSRSEKSMLVEMEDYGAYCSTSKLDTLLKSDFSKSFDPIKDYLERLVWDNEDHFGNLVDSIKTDDDEFFRVALRKYLLKSIDGWIQDEHFNEQMLVLTGGQNVGKSTLARNLTPPGLREYLFQGSMLQNKNDFLKQLSRKVFIVLDEFDGVSGKDIPWLKQLITQGTVETRLAYQRQDIREPRRASFIATTNISQPLQDTSGSRRMLTFHISNIDKSCTIDFAQMWAQLYTIYREGEDRNFTEPEITKICERNQRFTYRDILMEAIFRKFDVSTGLDYQTTVKDIAREILPDSGYTSITNSLLQKIGTGLNQAGISTRKSNGKRYYALKKLPNSVMV